MFILTTEREYTLRIKFLENFLILADFKPIFCLKIGPRLFLFINKDLLIIIYSLNLYIYYFHVSVLTLEFKSVTYRMSITCNLRYFSLQFYKN